jgi:hypothetical protein
MHTEQLFEIICKVTLTMMKLLISLLLLLVTSFVANAFAPRGSASMTRASRLTASTVVSNMMARPQDMQDQYSQVEEQNDVTDTPVSSEEDGLNVAGISLSLGPLLNLSGCAYQFSIERGLEIETFGEMKEINQFRSLEITRPPSSLPQ